MTNRANLERNIRNIHGLVNIDYFDNDNCETIY